MTGKTVCLHTRKDRHNGDIWLNIKYALLQMAFWTSAASAYAYLTQQLQYKGFAENEIGVINAVKLFSTVVFQIIIGAFSDRHAKRLPLKYIIAFLTAVSMVLTFIFYEFKLTFGQTVVLFVGFGATFTCISPLIDSLSIKYMNVGRNINYPLGRAAGSCAWAVSCVLFGLFCDSYGANRLILLQVVCIFVMLMCALAMNQAREPGGDDGETNPDACGSTRLNDSSRTGHRENSDAEVVHSSWYLLRNYPKYTWFLVGSALMFMGYNVGTTFLISVFERLGGSNVHYGAAEFVMAISEVPSAFILIKCRKKIPLDRIMLCCAVFMTLKNMFAAFTDSIAVLIISQSCEMLGFGLFYSGSVYLIEEMLSPADVVKGMSLINAFTVGIGEGIGALICGWVNKIYGLTVLMNTSVVISAISIICIYVMCRVRVSGQPARGGNSK